ncbi:hypothetical protein F2S72_25005 [Pseudomonas syringae pv. actinidiae]|nr:hypothetical protein [Pseudomonas syringae pv. actinidiae]
MGRSRRRRAGGAAIAVCAGCQRQGTRFGLGDAAGPAVTGQGTPRAGCRDLEYFGVDLLDSDQAIALGIAARRRFVDLLQRTGLALPVYVVVNGMDDVPGFQDLIAALPQDARQQMLGWSSPYEPNAVWESRWSDIAVDEVTQALSEAVIQIGALSGQLSADLSFLPERVQALRRNVQMLLEPVFQGNAHSEAMRFRGLYFTARRQVPPSTPACRQSMVRPRKSPLARRSGSGASTPSVGLRSLFRACCNCVGAGNG